MALSSAAAAAASCSLTRSAPSEPSRLSSSLSLRCPAALGGMRGDIQRLCALPRRQLLPVVTWPIVEAMKEQFSSLDELLKKSGKPILVDFYATWCGPCQYMVPVLDEVGATMGHKLQIVKIDTQKDPNIANQYKIEALPTFIIFRDGKQCDRFEGAMPKAQLIERIENALSTEKSV